MGAAPPEFTEALEALSDGIVIRDSDGGLVYASASARALLHAGGIDLDSDPSEVVAEYESAEDNGGSSPVVSAAQRLLGTGPPVRDVVVGLPGTDGEKRWISVTTDPMSDEQGEPRGSVTLLHDVTDRYAFARAVMADVASRFDVIWREAPLGMALVSVEVGAVGDIVTANAALERLVDRRADELRGCAHRALIHPVDRLETPMFAPLTDGSTRQAEWDHRLLRGDGSGVWVREIVMTVVDPHGRPAFAVCVFLDTTQQHEALEQRLAVRRTPRHPLRTLRGGDRGLRGPG